MQIQENIPLASFTSFGVGGSAEKLITVTSSGETEQILAELGYQQPWLLGHGTNVLISDQGLPGITVRFASGQIKVKGDVITADAGASWDDLVKTAIENNLWGIELMSGVPGSIGAANFINITAYSQANNDWLEWVEAVDKTMSKVVRLNARDLEWGYKQSLFQTEDKYIIVRAGYRLSTEPTTELTYQSALDVADELGLKPDTLQNRRAIILETRQRAGSLFAYGGDDAKTVGSFFRNPMVTPEQAEKVISFDETGKTKEQIEHMNAQHGGDKLRVSAAHCLLAAGFSRGQSWGPVRLHPQHVLKIENAGGATAQQIYDVAQEIMSTVKDKLGITLEPEAQFLGGFN